MQISFHIFYFILHPDFEAENVDLDDMYFFAKSAYFACGNALAQELNILTYYYYVARHFLHANVFCLDLKSGFA